MTQTEIYAVIKQSKKWLTTNQIAKKLNREPGSIRRPLKKVLAFSEIISKPVFIKGHYHKAYKIKEKTK